MAGEQEHKGWRMEFALSQDIQGRWSDRIVVGFDYAGGDYRKSLGGEVFFKTEEEAESMALKLARDWIESDGTIQLSQLDPAYFPFQFKVGDRVKWTLNEATEGTVQEGFLSGEPRDSSKVTYQVQKDDGICFTTQQECLVKLDLESGL
ncbi:MAG: hypothetical protein QGG33_07560 [Candidatus Krumholzibacteria bacterium]|nr:hypothetical protein [Candidatus Krumholzibacteria bacterium]